MTLVMLTSSNAAAQSLRAVLVTAAQIPKELDAASAQAPQLSAIVLSLTSDEEHVAEKERAAATEILERGLDLYYWIEIARHPPTADTHPKWMASLQGHPEWRRLFPDAPQPAPGELVKVYPWTPVVYAEAFAAHRDRVARLLAGKPAAKGLFLNDLQAAPSACGCGNTLCRWTPDYGPRSTATRLGDDAAARFVKEVRELAPATAVIPVWVTECEEHDREGACAGVGCFRGRCWPEYTRQLMPVAEQVAQLGVLLPVREFQRELPIYTTEAGWISHALASFQVMPPRHGGKSIESNRLIAILQGWDMNEREIAQQIRRVGESGAGGYVVAKTPIDQGWEPRIVQP